MSRTQLARLAKLLRKGCGLPAARALALKIWTRHRGAWKWKARELWTN